MRKRIFVVDDEMGFKTLYNELFPIYGLELIGYAADGEEAVRKLSEGIDPDLVLIDHRLPNKNGIDTMKELHAKDPDLPIVFISADESIRLEALKDGALDFLLKPFGKDLLMSAIDKHARKR